MPKKRKNELITMPYFRWLISQRDGVYQADGRSNNSPAGRHSLDTRDRETALRNLQRLDLTIAVKHGLADPQLLSDDEQKLVPLAEGRSIYETHLKRQQIAGGPGESTRKRYRAVLDKVASFAETVNVRFWNQVNKRFLDQYGAYLEKKYEFATIYLELTTCKQVVKHLIDEGHLPKSCSFSYPLRKPNGTSTHCWTDQQVEAMVEHSRETVGLEWMAGVITALACTGLRISELASLRWSDINLEAERIHLTDERTLTRKGRASEPRRTKSGRDRSLPIHPELLPILQSLKRVDRFVFHGPRGGRIKPDTIRNIFVRDVLTPLAKKFPTPEGEIGFLDGRLHSFRHYFCSVCVNKGTPEPIVMSWLGHADSRMVRHYYHRNDADAGRHMNRLHFVTSHGDEGLVAG